MKKTYTFEATDEQFINLQLLVAQGDNDLPSEFKENKFLTNMPAQMAEYIQIVKSKRSGLSRGEFCCKECGDIVESSEDGNSSVHMLCWMCLENYD